MYVHIDINIHTHAHMHAHGYMIAYKHAPHLTSIFYINYVKVGLCISYIMELKCTWIIYVRGPRTQAYI